MRFGVLGPLQIHRDEGAVELRTPMLRRMLAVLLSRAGRPAGVDELIDALWAEAPPARAAKTIQIYVHRLRRDLGEPERIVREPAGYAIRVEPGELDAEEFVHHVRQGQAAQRAGDPARAEADFRQALRLWRGTPYGDVADAGFLAAEVEGLRELRLQALEGHAAAALDLGRSGELVPELAALVTANPYRERLVEQLMVALYRSGRQAEALSVYRRVRARLMEELGVEPGKQLARLHEAILRRDPWLERPSVGVAAALLGHDERYGPEKRYGTVGRLERRESNLVLDAHRVHTAGAEERGGAEDRGGPEDRGGAGEREGRERRGGADESRGVAGSESMSVEPEREAHAAERRRRPARRTSGADHEPDEPRLLPTGTAKGAGGMTDGPGAGFVGEGPVGEDGVGEDSVGEAGAEGGVGEGSAGEGPRGGGGVEVDAEGSDAEARGAAGSAERAHADGDPPTRPAERIRPAQLPHDVPLLSGRDTELHELLSFVRGEGRRSGTVVISAIDGMAGVGKTALAVHAAHLLAPYYPDGQLFLDLHGFTQGVEAVQPPLALDRLLRAIGVTGDQIPHDVEERAALWRSRLADKRYLVLLDNAATESQVRSLLPASPGCLVLVTSRRRLTDLDAHPLSLDVLPVDDAVALFRAVAGLEGPPRARPADESRTRPTDEVRGRSADEVRGRSAEPTEDDLVREIVELCGRLPLAIRLLATRLRSRPGWTVADLVRRLRDTHDRLAELEAGRSVAGAFQLSYDQLDARHQRLFRVLGLHAGPEFGAHAAAALAGTDLRETEQALENLVDSHLLESRSYGRYTFHDLLRVHAAATAEREDGEAERRAALQRLFDHYLHTAARAMNAYAPAERHRRPEVPPACSPAPAVDTYADAVRWLDAERANLVALAGVAADVDAPEYASMLSTTLFRYLDNGLYCSEALALHNHALRATRAAGDRAGEARALGHIGATYQVMGMPLEALNHLHEALDRLSPDDDPIAWAVILGVLGNVLYRMGRFSQAQEHSRRAAELYGAQGDLPGEARALQTLGYIARELGRLEEAETYGRRTLTLARRAGDLSVEGNAHNLLGGIGCRMGRFAEALATCETGLGLHREAGNRVGEYLALAWGGRALRGLERYDESLEWCRLALVVAQEIDDPNGEFEAHQGLGETFRAAGRTAEALEHLREALQLARRLQQSHDEARAHHALGRTYQDLGDPETARVHLRQARDLYRRTGAPDAAAVEAGLAALGEPTDADGEGDTRSRTDGAGNGPRNDA